MTFAAPTLPFRMLAGAGDTDRTKIGWESPLDAGMVIPFALGELARWRGGQPTVTGDALRGLRNRFIRPDKVDVSAFD